ncbi:acetamidase/formamidase family protein [Brevibacillus fulvus]|uniref:Amidase n=1 Tax=Brevibacillus fulvus TaxID=1125967 RepID=A0A938XWB5_9BACL|nr:acetamidase/formamidase family protein [Brevibacillus fulvus]MBM7588868.1 amidase [Brevibacillus fulvus]
MEKISKQHCIYEFAAAAQPVLTVQPGTQVVFETMDCYGNQITESSSHQSIELNGINPATGPVAIAGAEPGDTLKVTIEQIELDEVGTVYLRPGSYGVKKFVEYPEVKRFPVEHNELVFDRSQRIPLRPMIGVIGVSPREGSISTLVPNEYGGNLDTKEITTGATVYLPVFQSGANLAIGDLHAVMGDGEVAGCGVEIGGKVTVTLELIKGKQQALPFVEDEQYYYALASHESLDVAAELAMDGMFHFLQEQFPHLTSNDLVCLLGERGDLAISQVVNPKKTAKFRFPKR